MNTFSIAVSMLSGAAPVAVQSDRGATANARRLIAGGGEWCADEQAVESYRQTYSTPRMY